MTDLTGEPATYDPCHPIEYVINPAGAPADYMSFIKPAIKAAKQATGLKSGYGRTTTATAESRRRRTATEARERILRSKWTTLNQVLLLVGPHVTSAPRPLSSLPMGTSHACRLIECQLLDGGSRFASVQPRVGGT
jgi:hypothetical protein